MTPQPPADTEIDRLVTLYACDPLYRFTEGEARLLADALAREREVRNNLRGVLETLASLLEKEE